MRVLVSTTAGAGHFGPLVPFAGALRRAGHDVVVAAPGSFASAVERAGFAHHPFADAPPEELQAVFGGLSDLSNDEGNAVVMREVFGRIDTRAALPGVEAVVDEWRPDLILRESCEFASYLVAEAAGIPHVHVAIGLASFGELAAGVLEDPLTEFGADAGLVSLRSAPTLTLVPESLEGTPTPPGGAGRYRDDTANEGTGPLPAWWGDSSDPLVYVTFGSVAGGLGLFPSFYRDVIAALAEVPVRVLLTTGDAGDPNDLGILPANVHVERWWPQKAVMPDAAAMVGHGGFGTTLLGLASGLPMVVVPLFADQPYNARRVAAVGAGIVLEGGPAAVTSLAGAVQRLLADACYRAAARRIAEEISQLRPVSASVAFLEQVAG
ncbi:MAG: glycosyltransferase [Actinomycetota bacterium]|nr:glycosyltransferase [Actinomycetota bacterium]